MQSSANKIVAGVRFSTLAELLCHFSLTPVPDDQMEFDHIIPHAKGGPTAVANIRLLCRTCNRKKGSSLNELLDPEPSI